MSRPRNHTRIASRFADALRAHRAARGLTLEALAEKLGVPTRTLSSWESDGRMPSDLALRAIARLVPDLAGAIRETLEERSKS